MHCGIEPNVAHQPAVMVMPLASCKARLWVAGLTSRSVFSI